MLNPETSSCYYIELRKELKDKLCMMKRMSLKINDQRPPIPEAISHNFGYVRSEIKGHCPIIQDERSNLMNRKHDI